MWHVLRPQRWKGNALLIQTIINTRWLVSDCYGGRSDSDDDDGDKVVVVGVAAMVVP